MDAALMAQLMGQGGGGQRVLGNTIPELDCGLETMLPLGEVCGESLLKKLMILFSLQPGFLFMQDLQGGFLYQMLFKWLEQYIKMGLEHVGPALEHLQNSMGDASIGDGFSPTATPSSGPKISGHEL